MLQNNINNEIIYVNDDPYEKAEIIQKYMKNVIVLFLLILV